jgi:hypothetical protein
MPEAVVRVSITSVQLASPTVFARLNDLGIDPTPGIVEIGTKLSS